MPETSWRIGAVRGRRQRLPGGRARDFLSRRIGARAGWPGPLKAMELPAIVPCMRHSWPVVTWTASVLVSVAGACGTSKTKTDIPDAASLTDASADVASTPDATPTDAVRVADATRILGDARTVPPNSVKCMAEWASSNHCQCIRTSPSSSEVAQCSAASLVSSYVEMGICCEDSFGCECFAYGCTSSTTLGICECGQAGASGLPADSTPVLECPSTSGKKCCLDANAHTCICSSAACSSTAAEVPSCKVADITTCARDATAWANCK